MSTATRRQYTHTYQGAFVISLHHACTHARAHVCTYVSWHLFDRDPHSRWWPTKRKRNRQHLVLLAVAGHRSPADGSDHLAVPLRVVEQLYFVGEPSVICNDFPIRVKGKGKGSCTDRTDHDLDHLLLDSASYTCYLLPLTRLGLQSRCGDKPLKFQVVCPQNGTAVLKGLTRFLWLCRICAYAVYSADLALGNRAWSLVSLFFFADVTFFPTNVKSVLRYKLKKPMGSSAGAA